jgi:CBS domain-containing protein
MRRRIFPDVVNGQDLVCLPPSATARAAARLMAEKRVSSVLVTQNDRLAGIVTVRDIARKIVGESRDADRTHLSAIMTPDPICADADDTPMTALRRMLDGGFRHLPVKQDGNLVGVLVRSDFSSEEAQCLEFEDSLWQHMR